jgi:putative oxidoreductase
MNTLNQQTSTLPLIGRLLLAAIFLISGVGKIAAPAATAGYIAAMGLPLPALGVVVAVLVEVGGGLLLVFGFKTRLIALLLAAFSIVTGIVFHHAVGDQNQMIHLLKNFAMAGGLLQVAAFGAGALSIDGIRSNKVAVRAA